MPCYHPLPAWRGRHGGIAWRLADARSAAEKLSIPCGSCFGCRQEYRRQWTVRCMMEYSMSDLSSFVTLTYDEEHNPHNLSYRDLQLFFKRLRKEFDHVRYYACGEYGAKMVRPHYHGVLFNVHFVDRVFHGSSSGFDLFRSPTLERLWPFGFSTIGDVTYESCAYVTGYVLKKMHRFVSHEYIHPETGEYLQPEFVVMSRRPGIGASFLERFKAETLRDDSVYIGGQTMMPPRFFLSRLTEAEQAGLRSRRVAKRDEVALLEKSNRAYVSERVARAKSAVYSRRPLEA